MSATPSQPAIRIVIADGNPDAITTFKKDFAPDSHPSIVGTANTAEDLHKLLSSTSCDALLLDFVTFGEMSVLEAVKENHPKLRVIYVAAQGPASDTLQSLVRRNVIPGFVKKGDKPEETVYTIETIFDGPIEGDMKLATSFTRLTAREKAVLNCLLEGFTTSEIASQLHRSQKTVAELKQSACDKLGANSLSELFKLQHKFQ
ncbi:hypothetical protein NQ176_g3591 [Zarea fungicola]|uniref:Uncharacterized protein n=1 Tax=Zarea fungicola TaxID=93591 RepID=A0ACC1NID1_9HYPO|nr:hypothetical protein NQ176_g3591 [Lecanicillium fungicola]